MLNMRTGRMPICSRKFPISIFPSCGFEEAEHATPHPGGFLLGWLQTKLPLTPQPARKWFDTKDAKMSSSPPTSLQTNGTGMRSERNPPPTRPLNSFTYLRAHSEEGVGQGTRDAGGQVEFGGRALHDKIWQAFASLQLLCVSRIIEKHKLSSTRSVVTPLDRAHSLQMLIVL